MRARSIHTPLAFQSGALASPATGYNLSNDLLPRVKSRVLYRAKVERKQQMSQDNSKYQGENGPRLCSISLGEGLHLFFCSKLLE